MSREAAADRLFGSSGIRQPFGKGLLSLAIQAGAAFASFAERILVGRDTRTTGSALSRAFIAGALAAGAEVLDAGVAPTPSIAYCARGARGAAVITASHNPEEYNGMKLLNSDGSALTRAQRKALEDLIGKAPLKDWEQQGSLSTCDAIGPHRRAILDMVEPRERFRIVVECGNGAGSLLTPFLLDSMHQQVITVNCNPAGMFARPSEPLPEHLSYLEKMVVNTDADFALAHDGDADRLVVYWKGWGFVSGDDLLILFARHLDARRVVTTYDASMAIEEVAEVHRVPVGDAHVSEELLRWGDFGGEPSGAIILPRLSFCPDGIHAASLFCELASETDVLGELRSIPRYAMLRESIACANAHEVLRAMGADEPTDGLRISSEEGWLLVRASGTEPKLRLTAEGRTKEAAKELLERGKELVQKGLKHI